MKWAGSQNSYITGGFLTELPVIFIPEIKEKGGQNAEEDILLCIEEGNLPYEQAKALLREPAPLDSCYHAWLKSDYLYMEDLRGCVEHHARRDKVLNDVLDIIKLDTTPVSFDS